MPGGACVDEDLLEKIGAAQTQDVEISSSGRQGDYLNGSTLSRVIRDEWARSSGTPLTSLTVRGLHIEGKLDLESCGSEGKPTIKLSFVGCRFVGGVSLVHCYLKSLWLSDCVLFNAKGHGSSRIEARRCVIVEHLNISKLLFAGPGAAMDFSGAKLSRGCTLTDIGNRVNGAKRLKWRQEWVSFKGAKIDGDLKINGLSLHNNGWLHKESALNLEKVNVAGTLSIASSRPDRDITPDIFGQVNLRSAVVGGRVRLESLCIKAPPDPKGPQHNQPSAIFGRLMVVAGDFLFRRNIVSEQGVCLICPSGNCGCPKPQERRDVLICGQVDLSDARIEGDLDFRGSFFVRDRIRALRCRRSSIGGHLRFGRLLKGEASFGCKIVGETDFTGSKIGGTVTFSGSHHRMSHVKGLTIENSRHKQGQAVNFRYAKLSRDMRFESGENICSLEGLSLIGASVEGRLLIGGACIRAKVSDGEERKAITANGAVIHGGIEIKEDDFNKAHRARILGDIRISNARIDGRFLISGAEIESRSPPQKASEPKEDTFRQRGVALWATNTKFGGDILIHHSGKNETKVVGEIRLWGATIEGTLFIQGVTLQALSGNATALDCYTADIKKGAEITAYFFRDQAIAKRTEIRGIVSFSFAKLQSLRMGSYWTAFADPSDRPDIEVRVTEKELKEGDTETKLFGTLLLRNMQVEGASTFENLLLKHSGHSGMDSDIVLRLEQLQVFRPYTSLHANYANFGSRLYVRLNPDSVGLINLFAATTGTVGGQTGPVKDPLLRENWGTLRKHWGEGENRIGACKAWGTLPLEGNVAHSRVLLNLDEFRYSRVNDPDEPEPWKVSKWERFTRRGILGQPFAEDVGPRFDWLQRQVNNPSDPNRAVISPYQQLAKVYREQGHLQLANNIVRARRWLQLVSAPEKNQNILGKSRSRLQNGIDRLFSVLFGFGYSPARALVTLISLWLFSLIVVSFGVSGCADKIMAPSLVPPPQSVAPSPQTITTHRIEHSSVGTGRTSSSTSDDASAQGHLGMSMRGRREQSYSVITEEVKTPTTLPPVVATKSPACWGFFCDTSDHPEASACHLATKDYKPYDVGTEAAKVILPFTRLNASANCSVRTKTPWWFRFFHSGLEMASWILFPLAAVTFSGILREKSDV